MKLYYPIRNIFTVTIMSTSEKLTINIQIEFGKILKSKIEVNTMIYTYKVIHWY